MNWQQLRSARLRMQPKNDTDVVLAVFAALFTLTGFVYALVMNP